MGWTNTHLYEFEIAGQSFGSPDEDDPTDSMMDAGIITLRSLNFAENQTFEYLYDFGDGWYHRIQIEAIRTPAPGETYPCCLKGKRACPPEDCGGPHRYPEVLKAIADPHHPEHEELVDWLGPGFDPESFDLHEVNEVLVSEYGPRKHETT